MCMKRICRYTYARCVCICTCKICIYICMKMKDIYSIYVYCWVGCTSCKKAGQLASDWSQDETSQSLWEKDFVLFHPLETLARMIFLVYSTGFFPASWLIVIYNLLPELEVLKRGIEKWESKWERHVDPPDTDWQMENLQVLRGFFHEVKMLTIYSRRCTWERRQQK